MEREQSVEPENRQEVENEIKEGQDQSDNSDIKRPHTRYEMLAKPRGYVYQLTRWVDRIGPQVRWGTQEMLTPPSEGAKRAVATPRTELLAKPKADKHENKSQSLYLYSCGRNSQLWLVSDGAQHAVCSPRTESLAKPKNPHKEFADRQFKDQYIYMCGRESPIWSVKEAAKKAAERPRTAQLAIARSWHPEYKPERPLPSSVSPSTRKATATERIQELATPRSKEDTQFREPMWTVDDQALKVAASTRTIELARFKPVYDGYQNNYDYGAGYDKLPKIIRMIPRNTQRAVASTRTVELAVPIRRETTDKIQFNPDAFIVKPTALKAYCPPRINELAQPLVR